MKNKINKPFKNKNFFVALKNAINGLIYSVKTESNLKIDILAIILVIIISMIFKISYIELLAVVITIGLVVASEMFNTAIENIVDLITEEYNEKAKIIKDISAGAVLVTSIIAVVVACIIFIGKIV